MKDKEYKRIGIISGALLLLSVAVLYITHRAVPFMMDDLWYATLLSEETPIGSLGDIIKSQIWHYNNWGGRSITHGILQLTLLAGEHWADILNVIFTLLLCAMISVVADNRRLVTALMALSMLLGLNANWKMSMFWQAGAANYLYITVFILLFIYCYLKEVPDESGRHVANTTESSQQVGVQNRSGTQKKLTPEGQPCGLPGITLWILPLGLIAGWSNENMGPVAWLVTLFVIGYRWKTRQSIRPWMVLGSLTSLLGSILVIVAPGNFVRSTEAAGNGYGVLWNCFLRGYAQSRAMLEYLFPTLLILFFILIISKGILRLPIGRRNLLLLFATLLSWGAMILSPHYPDRATFGTMTLLICVILSLTGRILQVRKELNWPFLGITLLIWLRGMYFLGEYLAITWGWIL